MAEPVQGKNCIIYLYKSGEYRLIACAKAMSLTVSTEMVPTTTPESGGWAQFRPGPYSQWAVTFDGLLILRDQVVTKNYALETITEQARRSGYNLKVVFEDDGGYSQYLAGSVLIPQTAITGQAVGFAAFNLSLQGTGPLNINGGALSSGGTTVETYEYTATGSENGIIQDTAFINAELLLVQKGQDEPIFVNAWDGTGSEPSPTESTCVHVLSTGDIKFAHYTGYQFNAEQRFRILYAI